ncbi:MAG: hemerythrin domain-containing protein [Deltaproteobacteria bacterium]|nr:hemerythrin domain-containing protein [Deltaproteobacteria bacterium]MBW2418094.1 hemerythrin domain-containing protein [Deltaproteobacteria bacterium]
MESDDRGEKGGRGHKVEEQLLEHIRESHRRLRSLLDALGNARDPEAIRTALTPLPELLSEHFSDEERPGGLFEGLREARPSIEPQLALLHAEHEKILEALRVISLQLESGEATDRALEKLKDAASALITMLAEHEQGESKLTAEAYYSDDGGSG